MYNLQITKCDRIWIASLYFNPDFWNTLDLGKQSDTIESSNYNDLLLKIEAKRWIDLINKNM